MVAERPAGYGAGQPALHASGLQKGGSFGREVWQVTRRVAAAYGDRGTMGRAVGILAVGAALGFLLARWHRRQAARG
jgi:hypothetical protein